MTHTITLQYFDGCPNWRHTLSDLREIVSQDPDLSLTTERIESPEQAEARAFRGSPTVLVDGVDPFADSDTPVGLSCRVYRTPDGRAWSPTSIQLRTAIAAAGT